MKEMSHVAKVTAKVGSCQQNKLTANGHPKKKPPRPITLAPIKKDKPK